MSDHALEAIIRSRVGELPDWLGPMPVKELRQALRAPFFLIPFVAIHLVALIALLLEFNFLQENGTTQAFTAFAGSQPFWIITAIVLAGIIPLRHFGLLANEMRHRNFELVLMSGLSSTRIAVGTWLVQCSLVLLIFVSLLPYIIVRYFFGGVEIVETAIRSVTVLGLASAMNALVIGASGYTNLGIRLTVLGVSMVVVPFLGAAGSKMLVDSHRFNLGDFFHVLIFCYWMLSLGMFFGFYTICGLQLAKGHLRPYEGSFDLNTTRIATTILILSPFIMVLGSVLTCFYGIGIILAFMLWWICTIDRGWN